MREKRILYFALGVLSIVSIGAVSLHDDGIRFPDGSFQETAAGFTATTAVQAQVQLETTGWAFCTPFTTIFSVPAGKRLVIEWIAAETAIFGGSAATHPVEVDIMTHDGSQTIVYPLARIENPTALGGSSFLGNRWAAPVRLYSEANQPVKVRMCLDAELEDEGIGNVGFSGYLVDV